ncbi:hypothetical protein MJO28_003559, partial [Puccinia striiformis f. sp. tritici]
PFTLSAELGPNPPSQKPLGNQLEQSKFHSFGERSGWLFCKSITTIQLLFSRRKLLLFLMLLYSLQVGLIQLFTEPNQTKPNIQQIENRPATGCYSNLIECRSLLYTSQI